MVRIAGALGLVVLALWLLSALTVGVTHSLAGLFGRLWLLTWWLQHFGLGCCSGSCSASCAAWQCSPGSDG